jgi:kynurenine formamidase
VAGWRGRATYDLERVTEENPMDDFRQVGQRLRNWGRWGDDDERGTVNLITPDRLVAAAALVRRGVVFDLGIPIGADGPQTGAGRINPVHLMSQIDGSETRRDGSVGAMQWSDDYIIMPLQSTTQWDGLAHVFYDDQLYNGFPKSTITSAGAERDTIDKLGKGVAGRGVLVDVARYRGLEWLEEGDAIEPAELERVLETQGVELVGGDILLVRTGWWKRLQVERSRRTIARGEPGLSLSTAEWLAGHEVAAVAADNHTVEVLPSDDPDTDYPLHCVLIRDMGMTLGEWFDLEELAQDCAADGVYEFLFCSPPLKVTGGVGSPLNPLAIK